MYAVRENCVTLRKRTPCRNVLHRLLRVAHCGETRSAASRRPKVGERIHHPPRAEFQFRRHARSIGLPSDLLADRISVSSYIPRDAQGKLGSQPASRVRICDSKSDRPSPTSASSTRAVDRAPTALFIAAAAAAMAAPLRINRCAYMRFVLPKGQRRRRR